MELYQVQKLILLFINKVLKQFGDLTLRQLIKRIYTKDDIKKIMKQLLQCVKIIHDNDIIHRDIKPGNLIFDSKTLDINLIDWGLAEFYFPNKRYNKKISTKPYKPPEILLGDHYYDKKFDIWGVGCILASLVIQIGSNELDQLLKIVEFMGSKQVYQFCYRKNITLPQSFENFIWPFKDKIAVWEQFGSGQSRDLFDIKTRKFLESLMQIDPVFQKVKSTYC